MKYIESTVLVRSMFTVLALVSALVWMPGAGAAEKSPAALPDYAKGEVIWDKSTWVLGPIGAVYVWSKDPTSNTPMMQIQSAPKDTPADGVLNAGDVILGVISPTINGSSKKDARFTSDTRKEIAAAITEAEKKANNGKLVLNVWRKGKTFPATFILPVKGTFSATSPWKCEKTTALVDAAAEAIIKKGFYRTLRNGNKSLEGGVANHLDALGLLATGDKKYVPVVSEFAKGMADQCLTLDIFGEEGGGRSMGTWEAAYRNLFLTEYYLITKDESVLPGITAISTYLAKGQSGVGTWSHGMSYVKQYGLYGPPAAYGAMNQCSMTCAISLLLAQKCGIKIKEIDDAVTRSLKFYRWYVDKGTIPYGDHAPAEKHDNNGKNSQAAVMYDLAGDKEAADFFTRMTLASYDMREEGHTGHYFSFQWGALGAARGGPAAAQSFIANTRWFTEIERHPDGGYVYQFGPRKEELGRYRNWSTNGSRIMQHCLPRQALYITGKGGSSVTPITGTDLTVVVDAGNYDPKGRSVKELLSDLGNWSLKVRADAAKELGERDENVVKELIAMLNSPNRYARYGACVGLEFAGRESSEAVDVMIDKLINDTDMTFRFFIVNSLKLKTPRKGEKFNGLGPIVTKTAPELFKLAATFEPNQDPTRKLHNEIADLLFIGYYPGGRGIEKVDRALLIPAMKSILQNPNGAARSTASQVYDNLNEEDLQQLWGDIYTATKYPAPSGVMLAGAVRVNGVKIMAEHHIKEGIQVGTDFVFRTEGWGAWERGIGGIPALKPYGLAIKDFFPDIESFRKQVEKNGKGRDRKTFEEAYEYMKKTPTPKLNSIEQFIIKFNQENPPK